MYFFLSINFLCWWINKDVLLQVWTKAQLWMHQTIVPQLSCWFAYTNFSSIKQKCQLYIQEISRQDKFEEISGWHASLLHLHMWMQPRYPNDTSPNYCQTLAWSIVKLLNNQWLVYQYRKHQLSPICALESSITMCALYLVISWWWSR